MKLVIQSNLKENTIQGSDVVRYNTGFILNNSWPNGKNIAQTLYANMQNIPKEEIANIISQFISTIVPLKNNKIVKAVANSVNGNILKLSNGRILKLFGSAYQDPVEDFKWFQQNSDKMYSGKADINTLPVFKTGQAKIGDLSIYYAEMAELYPLDKWLQKRGGDADTAVQLLYVAYLIAQQRNANMTPDQYAQAAISIIEKQDFAGSGYEEKIKEEGIEVTYAPLTRPEAKSFVMALSKMMNSGFKFNDVGARNIGILPSSASKDSQQSSAQNEDPVIVIFDR